MTMDLRFYNEETGQWEVMFANATDLSTHVANVNMHLQKGERDKINNALQITKYRLSDVDLNTLIDPGSYAMGVGLINAPAPYGTLFVQRSEDVSTQMYTTHLGELLFRAAYYQFESKVYMWTSWYQVTKYVDFSNHVNSNKHIHSNGINNNGWWIRFDDGTQMCGTIIPSNSPIDRVQGPIHSTDSQIWSYPTAFASTPQVFVNEASGVGNSWGGLGGAANGPYSASWIIYRVAPYSGHYPTVSVFAVGRWK